MGHGEAQQLPRQRQPAAAAAPRHASSRRCELMHGSGAEGSGCRHARAMEPRGTGIGTSNGFGSGFGRPPAME